MDANYTVDETLGEDSFCVNELTNDVAVEHTFIFPGGSKVHTELKLQKKYVYYIEELCTYTEFKIGFD